MTTMKTDATTKWDSVDAILKDLGKSDPRMVELGVLEGELTFGLFDRGWTDAHFVLIDPWAPHKSHATEAECRRYDVMHSSVELGAYGRNEDNFQILHMSATEARKFCNPGSADLVYIDFFYNKPIYMKTLRDWWEIVKPGGILAGHDFARYPEIEAAVMAFKAEVLPDADGNSAWWLPDSTSRARLDQLHKPPGAWRRQIWCLRKPAVVDDVEEGKDSAEEEDGDNEL